MLFRSSSSEPILNWFKVAGVPLRVGCLLGEAFKVGDEGLGLGESLGVLHALHVAFVRVAVRGSNGDDPIRARHLELEVGVVGDNHELGVAWSPQHCVVGSSEPDESRLEGGWIGDTCKLKLYPPTRSL